MKKILITLLMLVASVVPINAVDETTEIPESVEDSLAVSPTEFSLELYATRQLQVDVTTDIEEYTVTYNVTDSSIVSVDEDGFVSALKPGDTTIIVSVILKEVKHEQTVQVSVYPIESDIVFKQTQVSLERGESFKIEYTTSNPNIQNKDIIWNSSNASVVSVENGKVKALSAGRSTITAKIGNKTATLQVTVSVSLQRVEFNPSSLVLNVGNAVNLPGLIYVPYDTTANKIAIYESKNPEIVEIIDGELIPKKVGSTTVVAKVGSKEAVLNVEVKPRENEFGASLITFEPIESYATNVVMGLNYSSNDETQLFALVLPVNRTLDAMNAGKVIQLIVPTELVANGFQRVERISIPSEIMQAITENSLKVEILDSKRNLLARYDFANPTPYSMNLKFVVSKLAKSSDLGQLADGPAYEVRLLQAAFPAETRFSLPVGAIESVGTAMHFVYKIGDRNILTDTPLLTSENGKTLDFNVEQSRYLISFNAISKSRDVVAITVLAGSIFLILIIWLLFTFRNRGKIS